MSHTAQLSTSVLTSSNVAPCLLTARCGQETPSGPQSARKVGETGA
jgi:hypothetical protein